MKKRLGGALVVVAVSLACEAPDMPGPEPVRFTISIPDERELESFALSPAGSRIAYVAEDRGRDYLFVTWLAGPKREVTFPDSAGASSPFFSPDGQWVAFFADRQLKRVRSDGSEPAQRICEAPTGSAGGTWTDDDRILFAPLNGQGLLEVPASGGRPRPLTRIDRRAGEVAHGWPHALPGGATLFTVSRRNRDPQLVVLPPDGGQPRPLLPAIGQGQFVSAGFPTEAQPTTSGATAGVPAEAAQETSAVKEGLPAEAAQETSGATAGLPGEAAPETSAAKEGLPAEAAQETSGATAGVPGEAAPETSAAKAGHLVYGYLGNLLAVPFDLVELTTRGGPTIVGQNLRTFRGFGDIGRTALSVSRNGTLAWLRGDLQEPRSLLAWVDRAGRLVPLTELAGQYQSPRLSPDGRRIALASQSGVMTRDIRVIDAARPDRVLLTLRGGDNHSPVWRPDGSRLTFASNRDGPQDIYEASLDGGIEKLIPTDGSARNPTSWSHRPPVLAFYRIMPDGGRDIQTFHLPKTLNMRVATAANERSPALSENGRWLAYVSDQSGRDEVFVRPTNDPPGPGVQLSISGGVEPLWTKDGLIYREGAAVILVPFGSADGTLLEARLLFERRFQMDPGGNLPDYDVSRDGQRLLMLKSASHPREVRIVSYWGTELARTVRQ